MVVNDAIFFMRVATNSEAISVTTLKLTFTAFGSHPYPDAYTKVLCSLHPSNTHQILLYSLM